jgi:hypothetical protein
MRRANAMRGYGSIAMDVNDDNVAPWKGYEVLEELGGIKDVTTATGCAVSRRRARSLSFKLFEMPRVLQDAVWWLSATFFRNFKAVLVLVIPKIRPGMKLLVAFVS